LGVIKLHYFIPNKSIARLEEEEKKKSRHNQ
jgi:hypothetical protein